MFSVKLFRAIAITFGVICLHTQANAQIMNVDVGCSVPELINAVDAANNTGADEVLNLSANCTYTFTEPFFPDGDEALPPIINAGTLTIQGNGAVIERSFVQTTPPFRLFRVNSTANLTLNHVTLRNGQINTGFSTNANGGGAITNRGILTLNNSVVLDSEATGIAGDGGAVENIGGEVFIVASVISRNSTNTNSGGGAIFSNGGQFTVRRSSISFNGSEGILVRGGSRMNIFNSTIHNNTLNGVESESSLDNILVLNSTIANNNGDGIFFDFTTVKITNSIIFDNLKTDCVNVFNRGNLSGTNNIIGNQIDCEVLSQTASDNPQLGQLTTALNGTTYYPLQGSSPAIDAGNNTSVTEIELAQDQVGNRRISGSVVDIGAFELQDPLERLDLNNDGTISPSDAVLVVNSLGATNSSADVNGDGMVTQADVQLVIDAIGTTIGQ